MFSQAASDRGPTLALIGEKSISVIVLAVPFSSIEVQSVSSSPDGHEDILVSRERQIWRFAA
jgi:hypothetical protein